MSRTPEPISERCNGLALRQAARHVTQFYDQYLAPSGLRVTRFSLLTKLQRSRPAKAQARFESVFGDDRASELRTILRAVSASDLGATARAPIR